MRNDTFQHVGKNQHVGKIQHYGKAHMATSRKKLTSSSFSKTFLEVIVTQRFDAL